MAEFQDEGVRKVSGRRSGKDGAASIHGVAAVKSHDPRISRDPGAQAGQPLREGLKKLVQQADDKIRGGELMFRQRDT